MPQYSDRSQAPPGGLMTTPEAASYLRLSKSLIDKYRVFGGGPLFAKLGGRIVYSKEDLDAWISARKFSSTSEYSAGEAA